MSVVCLYCIRRPLGIRISPWINISTLIFFNLKLNNVNPNVLISMKNANYCQSQTSYWYSPRETYHLSYKNLLNKTYQSYHHLVTLLFYRV